MLKIENKEIHINRGDRATIRLKRKDEQFKIGDLVKFSIVDKRDYNNVYFQKEYQIQEDNEYVDIFLLEDDTRFLEIKKGFLECRYEIEYNGVVTLLGASDNDDNVIKIYAEAGDK